MKKIFVVALTAVIIAVMTVSTFAADDGLIGFYKLDGNFKNEVGVDGAAIGRRFNDPAGEPVFTDGRFRTVNGVDDGAVFNLDIERDFTIAFYANATYNFSSPFIWIGNRIQLYPENWIVIGCDIFERETVTVSSNDATGTRLTLDTGVAFGVDAYYTLVVSEGIATVYVDGVLVGATNTNGYEPSYEGRKENLTSLLPNPWEAEDCAIYVGVNCWDAAADCTYDNISVYNKAISADEVAALYAAGGDPTVGGEGEAPAPQTGFATIALAVVAIASGAYIVSKKH